MSGSGDRDVDQSEGVDVAALGDDEPVLGKHMNLIVQKQQIVIKTVQGFAEDLSKAVERLDNIEGKEQKDEGSGVGPSEKVEASNNSTARASSTVTKKQAATSRGGKKDSVKSASSSITTTRKRHASDDATETTGNRPKTNSNLPPLEAVFEEEPPMDGDLEGNTLSARSVEGNSEEEGDGQTDGDRDEREDDSVLQYDTAAKGLKIATVDDVLTAQPQPIQNALRVFIQELNLVELLSSGDLLRALSKALPHINEHVVALRGSLPKLRSAEPVLRKHINPVLIQQKDVMETVQGFAGDLKMVFKRSDKIADKKRKGEGSGDGPSKKSECKENSAASSAITKKSTATSRGGKKRSFPSASSSSATTRKRPSNVAPSEVGEEFGKDDNFQHSLLTALLSVVDNSEVGGEDDAEIDEDHEYEGDGESDYGLENDTAAKGLKMVEDGGMPVPNMKESDAPEVNGKVFRAVLNGKGFFLHYTSLDKFIVGRQLIKESLEMSFEEVDSVTVDEVVHNDKLGQMISLFALLVIKDEIGNHPQPIYLMKDIQLREAFKKEEVTVNAVVAAQPQPIQRALSVVIHELNLRQKLSSENLLDELFIALPEINECVVKLRGGLPKLRSPGKAK